MSRRCLWLWEAPGPRWPWRVGRTRAEPSNTRRRAVRAAVLRPTMVRRGGTPTPYRPESRRRTPPPAGMSSVAGRAAGRTNRTRLNRRSGGVRTRERARLALRGFDDRHHCREHTLWARRVPLRPRWLAPDGRDHSDASRFMASHVYRPAGTVQSSITHQPEEDQVSVSPASAGSGGAGPQTRPCDRATCGLAVLLHE
jgi:hypothetical protein